MQLRVRRRGVAAAAPGDRGPLRGRLRRGPTPPTREARPGCRSPSRPSSPRAPRPPGSAPPAPAPTSSTSSRPRSWPPASTEASGFLPRAPPGTDRSGRPESASWDTRHRAIARCVPGGRLRPLQRTRLEEGAALVFAEDLAHGAADLADRGVGFEGGADRVQEVALAAGDGAEG